MVNLFLAVNHYSVVADKYRGQNGRDGVAVDPASADPNNNTIRILLIIIVVVARCNSTRTAHLSLTELVKVFQLFLLPFEVVGDHTVAIVVFVSALFLVDSEDLLLFMESPPFPAPSSSVYLPAEQAVAHDIRLFLTTPNTRTS